MTDWFERINIMVLATLVLVTTGMLVRNEMEHRTAGAGVVSGNELFKRHYSEIQARNATVYREVIELEEAGRLDQAMAKLRSIIKGRGDDAYAHLLMARLYYGQGHLADSIHAYRLAVEKDPDYVDKKTPLFHGEEIMERITESRTKLNREKKLKPGDRKILTAINDIYYLQRRIAGGCE